MENQEPPASRTNGHLEVEMPKSPGNKKITQTNPTRFPACSFSKTRHKISDQEQRSNSTLKLSGLILFYTAAMAVEIVGGLKANSLAVLTDAAHLLTDIAGISLSLFTVRVSGRAATPQLSFGFARIEILGALVSIQLIWLISVILIHEAIDRILHENGEVNGKVMFGTALFGFLMNSIMVLWIGHDHSHHGFNHDHDHNHDHEHESENLVPNSNSCNKKKLLNINLQGAYLHVIADMIQSIGVMIAGSIIWAKPNFLAIDLVCTLIFAIFALTATLPMLRNMFYVLMEGCPSEIDVVLLENGLKGIEGLVDVHDLHVWAITVGKIVLACHVVVETGVDSDEVVCRVRDYCEKSYDIHHVTVQIEHS